MKAYVVTGYKKPLQQVDRSRPGVGARDVLVRVEAAGLNQLDEKIRAGEFRQLLAYRAPFVLGHDVAGVVVEVGSAVRRFRAGDEVYGRVADGRIGTFAEFVAVAEDDLAMKPASLSMVEAGSLPLVALTAWQALVEIGRVEPGAKVLVHAGTGGVGTVAIQLAKHLGATVATTVSGRNAAAIRKLGADVVIDYRTEDFAAQLRDYDLVIDSQGPDHVKKSLRVLRPGGTVIGIAGPPDPDFARAAGLNPVLRLGIALLSRPVRRLASKLGVAYRFLFMRANSEQLTEITRLVDSGVLRPVVGKVLPFDDLPAALSAVGSDGTVGKTVVTVP